MRKKEEQPEVMKQAKVVLLGGSAVGKTSIVQRLVLQTAPTVYQATIGLNVESVKLQLPGLNVAFVLELWDTSGEEQFRSVGRLFYRGAQAAVLAFDVSNQSSYLQVEWWMKELKLHAAPNVIVIVGNKCDIIDTLRPSQYSSLSMMQEYAEQQKAFFKLVSAKDNIGVNDLFADICRTLYNDFPQTLKDIHTLHPIVTSYTFYTI